MGALLELDGVTARYGPVQALHGVSLIVGEGEIAAVLGANGAGKTTTLRAISGSVRRDGELRFAGKRLGRLGPAPLLVTEIFRIVRELNEQEGLTVLVVEQNAHIALQAAQTAYVLEVGHVALAGPSAELQQHESIRRSYLGY